MQMKGRDRSHATDEDVIQMAPTKDAFPSKSRTYTRIEAITSRNTNHSHRLDSQTHALSRSSCYGRNCRIVLCRRWGTSGGEGACGCHREVSWEGGGRPRRAHPHLEGASVDGGSPWENPPWEEASEDGNLEESSRLPEASWEDARMRYHPSRVRRYLDCGCCYTMRRGSC